MPWAVAGAAVAAAGSVAASSVSANAGSKAGKKAANAQAYAAGEANYNDAAAQAQYRADVEPYMGTGNRALSLYESILSGVPLNKTSGFEAGFNPNGTNQGNSALGVVSPQIRNAILSRQIKSPGGSDWADGTYRKEIAQGAKTSGSYLGVDQADWQAAMESLNNVGMPGDGNYDAATYGAYGNAADGTDFGIGSVDNYQKMQSALGQGDYSSFFNSPDYQFALSEGLKGVDRSAAAKGNLLSGAQIKATNNYAQGVASQQFGNYYGRTSDDYNKYLDRLANLAAGGQNAAVGVGNAGISTANSQSSALQNAGTANASGIVGSYNAQQQGNAGIASALGQFGGSIGGQAGGSSGLNSGSNNSGLASILSSLFGSGGSMYSSSSSGSDPFAGGIY